MASGIPEPELASKRPNICGKHAVEGNLIHRVFLDVAGQPYFGYDLQVIPNPNTRTIRVEVMKPHPTYTIPPDEPRHAVEPTHIDGKNLRSFSVLPPATTLTDGDRVDVPVLENRSTGARFLDSYAIALPGTGVTTAPFGGNEFPSIAPAGTLLHLEQPHLGRTDADVGGNPEFGVTGPVVWVYGRWTGRFLFSAAPRPGYRRLGIAKGSRVAFTLSVERYNLDLQSQVTDKPGIWWIWVRHEPDFKPPPGVWTEQELRRGMLAIGAER
jgi:hypothetical protein